MSGWEKWAARVRRWQWVAWPTAALLWGCWLGGYVLGGGLYDLTDTPFGGDHVAFYTPGVFIREGRAGDIYDCAAVGAFQRELFPGVWGDGCDAFRNPPFYALLHVPTSGLSYLASAWVWAIASGVALVVGVRWLGPADPWRTTAWALTFYPVYAVPGYGQNSLLSFAVFAGTYRLLAADRRFAAGLAAGLLWFKPPLLIGLLVWWGLSARRYWPCLAGVVATGTILTLGTLPVIPEAWEAFVRTLPENVGQDGPGEWRSKLQTPQSFWRLLLPGAALGPVRSGLTLAALAAGVVVFVRVWRRRTEVPVMFGAAVALTLWTSPHVMIYEWALAVVPAVLWWEHAPEHRPAWRVIFAVVWVAFLAATDTGGVVWEFEKQYLGWSRPWYVLFSVPVAGWAGWRAARLLAPINPPPSGSPP